MIFLKIDDLQLVLLLRETVNEFVQQLIEEYRVGMGETLVVDGVRLPRVVEQDYSFITGLLILQDLLRQRNILDETVEHVMNDKNILERQV